MAHKRKASADFSTNPRTVKERMRQAARDKERASYEKAKKADVEAERRKLVNLRKTPAYQAASQDIRDNLAAQARAEVRNRRLVFVVVFVVVHTNKFRIRDGIHHSLHALGASSTATAPLPTVAQYEEDDENPDWDELMEDVDEGVQIDFDKLNNLAAIDPSTVPGLDEMRVV